MTLRRAAVLTLLVLLTAWARGEGAQGAGLTLNDQGYFERQGVNLLVFSNWYSGEFSDSKLSGIEVIHHGVRTATNGDVRLSSTPEQWDPIPQLSARRIDKAERRVQAELTYPAYAFRYRIDAEAHGEGVLVSVNLTAPLPDALEGRAGFNLEFLPSAYFGKTYLVDRESGLFPRHPGGPMTKNAAGPLDPAPLASGSMLVLAPEDPARRVTIDGRGTVVSLYDGRNMAQNGWFVVRSLIPPKKTGKVLEWLVTPNGIPGWTRQPVIAHSQVGYHPAQSKIAVLETDPNASAPPTVRLLAVAADGRLTVRLAKAAVQWGRYLRYDYAHFDFTGVREPGLYVIEFAGARTEPFRIAADVYQRGVWQSTLDTFLPVQMDHVLVNDRYRVWHGASHLDDARQAPVDHVHFDLYAQGPTTDSPYRPGQHIPGLNVGGWFDAGDFDIRTQSQYAVVSTLALARETFGIDRDQTTVEPQKRLVDLGRPDGRPDILQQIEHGTLALLSQYRAVGHAIAGVVEPTLAQYTHLGDAVTKTDGLIYNAALDPGASTGAESGIPDDRWAFTSRSTALDYGSIAALAAASRVLRGYNDGLAEECLRTAVRVWDEEHAREPARFRHGNTTGGRLEDEELKATVELLITTKGQNKYADRLAAMWPYVEQQFAASAALVTRALPYMDAEFRQRVASAVTVYKKNMDAELAKNPFGVPIATGGWGGSGAVLGFAMGNYILHQAFPDIIGPEYTLRALDYVLGTHPASDVSLVSGVGARSKTIAYGSNRADYSFIPGGVVPGIVIVKPDFPELKEDWPFLWFENEYVIGAGALFIYVANAVDALLHADPATTSQAPLARTESGSVSGTLSDGVAAWKGIPFAAPPVGNLRWREPQPPAAWEGVRPATEYAHDCMQEPFPSDAAALGTPPGEDCLYLNIWAPAAYVGARLPVVVWIYGGGFVNGGSSPAVYDGSHFAARGVVLVSFNYRLGRFGFFAHPALTAATPGGPLGNYGYLDQIAALKWVQRNIAGFGGDPGNVTIFGESAGGSSVYMLITSPLASGLFHKAIVQSGGGRAGGIMTPRRLREAGPHAEPPAEAVGLAFAKRAGIAGEDAAALAALRALPAADLVAGLNLTTMGQQRDTYAGPILDGRIVVEEAETAFRAGRQARVPFLVGANDREFGFMPPSPAAVDGLLGSFGPDKARALAAYDPEQTGDNGEIGIRIVSDQAMVEPARLMARLAAAGAQPTYAYRFSYVASSIRKNTKGALHATEIPFVFETVRAKYGDATAAQDEAIAAAMNAYWVSFARTGDPSGDGRPNWPAYSATSDVVMDFTIQGPVAGPDPLKARLDVIERRASAAVPEGKQSPPPRELTAEQDHRRLMDLLGIQSIRFGADPRNLQAPNAVNYDEAKANPYPGLPDPLVLKNGKRVTSAKTWWEERRPEIVEDFDREVYGRVPRNTPPVKWEVTATATETVGGVPVITKTLVGHVDNSGYPTISVDIEMSLTTPADAAGPVPIMLEFGFRLPTGAARPPRPPDAVSEGPTWQAQLVPRGWGYAILYPNTVQADNGAGLTRGIVGLVNKGQPRSVDDWGALRAWAWGASRALDYFETDKAVDARQVGIEGLSRYGKAALVAMAYDPRFAIALVASSGEGGAKLHRRNFGELVENVAGSGEYHWMAGNFIKYAGPLTANDLPVDAHELIALCAPRPVFISSGSLEVEGGWVDQKGMFLATVGAGPVYRLLGKRDLGATEFPPIETALIAGDLAFRQHRGGHTAGPNWPTFLTFAERYIRTPPIKAPAPDVQATPGARPKVALTFDDLPAHAALPPGVNRADIASSILSALSLNAV